MKYDIKIWEWTDREKRIIKLGERIFRLQFEIYDKKKEYLNRLLIARRDIKTGR
jgi:hypothetical protein